MAGTPDTLERKEGKKTSKGTQAVEGAGDTWAQRRKHAGLVPVFKHLRGTEPSSLAQRVHRGPTCGCDVSPMILIKAPVVTDTDTAENKVRPMCLSLWS